MYIQNKIKKQKRNNTKAENKLLIENIHWIFIWIILLIHRDMNYLIFFAVFSLRIFFTTNSYFNVFLNDYYMIFCAAFPCFRFCLQCVFLYVQKMWTFFPCVSFDTNTKRSICKTNQNFRLYENQTKRIHLHINCVYLNIHQIHFYYIVQSTPWHFIQISNKIYIHIIICFS